MNQSAKLQDELTGVLIAVAKSSWSNPKTADTDHLITEGLLLTDERADADAQTLTQMIRCLREEKNKIVPNCAYCTSPCGNTSEYDIDQIRNESEETRSLKFQILRGIRQMAGIIYPAQLQGYEDESIHAFFQKALSVLSYDLTQEELMPTVRELEEVQRKCEALWAQE